MAKVETGRRQNGWHKGNIEVLPSGRFRWRVRVGYPDGTHARRTGTARTKTEAMKAIMEVQQDAQAGRKPVADKLTLAEMVTEHMEGKRAAWADRTYWNNEALYKRHILPHIGHLNAAGMEPRAFRAYFDRLEVDGLGHSGRRQIHVLLSGAYKRAIGDGLLRDNPMTFARPTPKAKGGAAKVKHFDPDEAGRFIAAALEDRWAIPLAFLAFTGMRIGEALALTWADFLEDPDAQGAYMVKVDKTRSEFEGKVYEGAPKTEAGRRFVTLQAEAVAIVEDMRRRVALEAGKHGQGVGAYIFPSIDGRPMRQDVLRAVMRRTCERAGVPLLSPHALRHTYATLGHAQGWNVAALSKQLGHRDVSTTLNLYRHDFRSERHGLVLQVGTKPAQPEAPAKADVGPVASRPPSKRPRKGGPRRA